MNHRKEHRGFTLIELLLVIGIIASLASIVILSVNPTKVINDARRAEKLHLATQLQKAMTQYYIDSGSYLNAALIPTGNAMPICKQGVTNDATCINLTNLTPTYIAAIPRDSNETVANYSGYEVRLWNNKPEIYPVSWNRNGLVGYWRFDETAGVTIRDSSYNGATGTLQGSQTVQWGQGRINNSFRFIPSIGSQYFVITQNSALSSANALTIAFWINIHSNDVGYASQIINKWGGADVTQTANYALYLFGTSGGPTGQMGLYANAGGVWQGITNLSPVMPLNTWTHMAITYDTVNGSRTYINGILTDTRAAAGVLTTNSYDLTSYVGDSNLDDLRIYNRALTQKEVIDIYNGVN